MTLKEMEKVEKGNKAKKVFKRVAVGLSIAFNVFFASVLAVGCATSGKKSNTTKKVNNEVVYRDNRVQPKYASYDDEGHYITLNYDELNNVSFNNFSNYLGENYDNDLEVVISEIYTFDGDTRVYYQCDDFDFSLGSFYFSYVNDADAYIKFESYHFYKEWNDTRTNFDDNVSLTLSIGSSYYEGVKSAIQSDINPSSGNITSDIFTAVSDTMGGFINTLNSGVGEMVNMFYDSTNNQLTTLGTLVVIVVAVALAYWLFRFIIGLIRLRG